MSMQSKSVRSHHVKAGGVSFRQGIQVNMVELVQVHRTERSQCRHPLSIASNSNSDRFCAEIPDVTSSIENNKYYV